MAIDGKVLKAHRVVWFHTYGVWPLRQIDHINGIRDDNRIANLRDVSHAENSANRHRAHARSGLLGAHADRRDGGFHAKITRNGVERSLGRFKTAEEAHSAYVTARAALAA